jgi:predicted AAA+ superfamily ATPase
MSNAMDIEAVLNDQNLWWNNPKHREALAFRTRRWAFGRLEEYAGQAHEGRAVVMVGPRQVGKTTLLLQVASDLLDRGWPPGNLTFFDFADERLVAPVAPRDIVATRPVGVSPDYPRLFLFDEIQEAPSWPKWLKSAVDQARRGGPATRFIVTGSAAASLRDGAVESGQGRWDEIPIEGLTFKEFLALGSPLPEQPQTLMSRQPQLFDRYLSLGGFPEHVRSDFPREARRRIRDDIAERAILRDLRRSGVEIERVRQLFLHLVAGSGNAWSQGNRADDLGANRKSVGDWLSLLESTHLLSRLERDPALAKKARAQLRSQPKIYASDHGLITAFSPYPDPLDVAEVRGRIYEAVVFRHLRDVARASNGTLSFLRLDDDLELDFVLRHPGGTAGIEVTSSTDASPRKLSRASDIMKRAGITKKLLIHGGLTEDRAGDIDIVPLHLFLLEPERFVGGTP